MGMDVYGKNPQMNKSQNEYPTLNKYEDMVFNDRWKLLDNNEEERERYWDEKNAYEKDNAGVYFRNNCWWWRPLWNYCYHIADDLISNDLFESGHSNDGSGLNAKDAKKLGERLLKEIANNNTIKYQAEYQQYLDDLPDDNCGVCNDNNHGHNKKKECKRCDKTGKSVNFNKHYPFDIDNVKEFAEFCIQSGGFEIC